MQSQILTYLREQHHLTVDKIHEFTDGCAGQYKSKHTFGDLSCCLADFGVQIDRHFFETSVCPYNQIWKIDHAPIALWVMLILCNFVNMYN